MKFSIEYTGKLEERTLIYCAKDYSFDTEPTIHEISFSVCLNTLNLTVVGENENRVAAVWGFCGLSRKMIADCQAPIGGKGKLLVLDSLECGLSYGINDDSWAVYVNPKTGWVCIGNPKATKNAVEFMVNCIAVVDGGGELTALWLKPESLPKIFKRGWLATLFSK